MTAELTKLAYTIESFAEAVEISRSAVYEEISAGRLIPSYRGRSARIPRAEAERWLSELPTERRA